MTEIVELVKIVALFLMDLYFTALLLHMHEYAISVVTYPGAWLILLQWCYTIVECFHICVPSAVQCCIYSYGAKLVQCNFEALFVTRSRQNLYQLMKLCNAGSFWSHFEALFVTRSRQNLYRLNEAAHLLVFISYIFGPDLKLLHVVPFKLNSDIRIFGRNKNCVSSMNVA